VYSYTYYTVYTYVFCIVSEDTCIRERLVRSLVLTSVRAGGVERFERAGELNAQWRSRYDYLYIKHKMAQDPWR